MKEWSLCKRILADFSIDSFVQGAGEMSGGLAPTEVDSGFGAVGLAFPEVDRWRRARHSLPGLEELVGMAR